MEKKLKIFIGVTAGLSVLVAVFFALTIYFALDANDLTGKKMSLQDIGCTELARSQYEKVILPQTMVPPEIAIHVTLTDKDEMELFKELFQKDWTFVKTGPGHTTTIGDVSYSAKIDAGGSNFYVSYYLGRISISKNNVFLGYFITNYGEEFAGLKSNLYNKHTRDQRSPLY